MNIRWQAADRGPVPPGVFKQAFVLRNPDGLLSPAEPVVENARCDLPALPRAGSIAKEVALPICATLFAQREPHPFFGRREFTGQILLPGVARIDHCFELGFRQLGLRENPVMKRRNVVGYRSRDRSHRDAFDQWCRMLARVFDLDAARSVRNVDACLCSKRTGHRQFVIGDWKRFPHNVCPLDFNARSRLGAHRAKHTGRLLLGHGRTHFSCRDQRRALDDPHFSRELGDGLTSDDRRLYVPGSFVDDVEADRHGGPLLPVALLKAIGRLHRAIREALVIDLPKLRARCEPVRHDCDQAPTRHQLCDRSAQVSDRSKLIDTAAIGPREWWVHEDERRPQSLIARGRQHRAIEAGDGRGRKQKFKLCAAFLFEFVKVKLLHLWKHRDERSMPSARFKDDVLRAGLCQHDHQGGKVRRRRELLEADLIFTADRVGRQGFSDGSDAVDVRQTRCRVTLLEVAAETCFEEIVSVPLSPLAVGRPCPMQLAHRPKERLLCQILADLIADLGDCGVETRCAEVEEVGHSLLLMLLHQNPSPSPFQIEAIRPVSRSPLPSHRTHVVADLLRLHALRSYAPRWLLERSDVQDSCCPRQRSAFRPDREF